MPLVGRRLASSGKYTVVRVIVTTTYCEQHQTIQQTESAGLDVRVKTASSARQLSAVTQRA